MDGQRDWHEESEFEIYTYTLDEGMSPFVLPNTSPCWHCFTCLLAPGSDFRLCVSRPDTSILGYDVVPCGHDMFSN